MRRNALISCFLISLMFLLSSCVSREQADVRLARGCAAGAEVFLEEGLKIKTINSKTFGDNIALGKNYREVRLEVIETDDWYEADKTYKCIFVEYFAPFNLKHTATIYQLIMNGETYGKKGNEILGSFQDHLKLTEAVEQAMNF